MTRIGQWARRQGIESWITLAVVVGSMVFVFLQLQPHLLFRDTTPAGGDMGAHVWAPAFLREHLLPNLRLAGWAPDWYAGFPAYHFYMVLPSLAIVFLDVVLFLPYNIAFKLVAVSGLVFLPLCAYAMGRLARLSFPSPLALSLAAVAFVFDRSYSIYGGNAASTLAGEFAFSISLCFALLFLGMVLRGLDTGRNRAWAAVLLALTVLNHVIPAIFAVLGAVVALLHATDWRGIRINGIRAYKATGEHLRGWWLVSIGVVGGLLSAFWTVPFVLRRGYMNDMGWEKLTTYSEALFPGRIGRSVAGLFGDATNSVPGDQTWVILLALVGAGTALFFRRRFGTWVVLTAVVLAFGVRVAPQGRLWNARLLPFWYLFLYFLAALALVEIILAVAALVTRERDAGIDRRSVLIGTAAFAVLALGVVAFPLRSLPFGEERADGRYSWFGLTTADRSYVKSWARWNFSGYEDDGWPEPNKKAYSEYREVVSAMGTLGEEQGCGRAMWEYEKELDRFGTPMALMLLPYWTDGCIGSMEGLYFEASTTTPYHFINQSELSAAPSRAQRDLPYGELDVALGVDHLQLLGVKYYMAFSPSALAQADAEPNLSLVASVGKWRVYQVAHSEIVQPLAAEPAVVSGVKDGKAWQEMAVQWYVDRSRWEVLLAADGPERWQRVRTDEKPAAKSYSATTITELVATTDKIKFQVDRPGAPVLVKASYFPNWKAKGAEGPYRVAPNLMVVIPTDNFVTLTYGRTWVDWLGIVLTAIGIWLTARFARSLRLRIPPRTPRPQPVVPPMAEEDELATVGGPDLGGRGVDERWNPPSGGDGGT